MNIKRVYRPCTKNGHTHIQIVGGGSQGLIASFVQSSFDALFDIRFFYDFFVEQQLN